MTERQAISKLIKARRVTLKPICIHCNEAGMQIPPERETELKREVSENRYREADKEAFVWPQPVERHHLFGYRAGSSSGLGQMKIYCGGSGKSERACLFFAHIRAALKPH